MGWRREELSCTAMIGSSSGKTVLKRLVVAAEFIRPVIEFSRREIKFERKRIPGVEFSEQMAGKTASQPGHYDSRCSLMSPRLVIILI